MSPLPTLAAATGISKKFEMLSNVYRVLIVAYLLEHKEGSWSEIKHFLESRCGTVNPNTLHFHLKSLSEASFIKRVGSEDKPSYEIDQLPGEIANTVRKATHSTGRTTAGGS